MRELLSFLIPKYHTRPEVNPAVAREIHPPIVISVIIPSYKPSETLVALAHDILSNVLVKQLIVVDDATPKSEGEDIFTNLNTLSQRDGRLTVIHNEENLMCAGAINQGLQIIKRFPHDVHHGVLVINDDAKIDKHAIDHMCLKLWSRENLGAVCTQARVLNAKSTLVTRLQRLEYLSFNIARKADEGFLKGPLIMPGLATLFRAEILLDALKGYDTTCLIEDYEMTVRLKQLGWEVALAENAITWTIVPDSFKQLLRQRVRWYYGGLTVLRRHWAVYSAVLPDIVSHLLNISLLALIVLSFFIPSSGPEEPNTYFTLRGVLLSFGLFGLLLNILFLLWLDSEKDWIDVIIRCTFITEIYYQTFLSYVIFGSYFFYAYQSIKKRLETKFKTFATVFYVLDKWFKVMGFTATWGTK